MRRNHIDRPPHVRDRCGRTGKVRYKSKRAAIVGLVSAKQAHKTDPRREESRVYSCIYCGGYHLTSQPIKDRPIDGAQSA